MTVAAHFISRRIKGGAIVTVTRGERVRRYRVSLLRHARLGVLLGIWTGAYGSRRHGGTFSLGLPSSVGYAEALRAVHRYGGKKTRALFPSSRPRRAVATSPAAFAAGAF